MEEISEQEARPLLVEPQQLLSSQGEDTSEDQSQAAIRVRLRIGERQRRAPRSSKDDPAVDAEVLSQLLDVLYEMPGRVLLKRGVRGRLSRASLVEQDAAVVRGIKVLSVIGSIDGRSWVPTLGRLPTYRIPRCLLQDRRGGRLQVRRSVGHILPSRWNGQGTLVGDQSDSNTSWDKLGPYRL